MSSSVKNTPKTERASATPPEGNKPTISSEVKGLKDKIADLEGRVSTLEQLVISFSTKLENFSNEQSSFKTKIESKVSTSSTPYFSMAGARGPEVNKTGAVSVADILANNRNIFG